MPTSTEAAYRDLPCRGGRPHHSGAAAGAARTPLSQRKGEPDTPYPLELAFLPHLATFSGGRRRRCETDDARIERDNPFLSRADTLRLVARSLALYQRRNSGRLPTRLVLHKSTEFRKEEIEGCFDAWSRSEGLELVQVQQDTTWQGIKIDKPTGNRREKGIPASYPVDRGTFLQLGGYDALLWTQGNARQVVTSGNFYEEGQGIPHPILLRRFAGHGSWQEPCRHVLGLTKMNWNNDSLYDRLPVTLSYARTLAQTVRRMPQIVPTLSARIAM